MGEKIQAWKKGPRSTEVSDWAITIHSSRVRLPGAWAHSLASLKKASSPMTLRSPCSAIGPRRYTVSNRWSRLGSIMVIRQKSGRSLFRS